MDSLQVNGKVIQVLDEQSGEGRNGTWRRRDFILETFDQYPRKICISQWGNDIDQHPVQENQEVTAFINIQSREYNGRWYTDVRAWRLSSRDDVIEQNAGQGDSPKASGTVGNDLDSDLNDVDDELPF